MKKLLITAIITGAFAASSANAATTLSKREFKADAATSNVSTYEADSDPQESLNRSISSFNNVVDDYVYKPVARSYRYVVPQWGRTRVTNIVYNLTEPLTFANSALQGDPQNTFTSLWRFLINSTIGLLGTFDAANELGLKPRQEDFGQTLAVWGWKSSDYFVIPFLGPSTFRDTLGMGVEFVADPVDIYVFDTTGEQIAHTVVEAVDRRSELLPATDEVERTSLDKYASYRSIYLQQRRNDISNGEATPTY